MWVKRRWVCCQRVYEQCCPRTVNGEVKHSFASCQTRACNIRRYEDHARRLRKPTRRDQISGLAIPVAHDNPRQLGKGQEFPEHGEDDDDDDDDDAAAAVDGNGNGFSWRSLSHSQEHILKKKKKTTQQLCSTDL